MMPGMILEYKHRIRSIPKTRFSNVQITDELLESWTLAH